MNLPNYKFLQQLQAVPGIKKIILFGSRARGQARVKSDIDLAIELSPIAPASDTWLMVLDVIEAADTLLHIDCINFSEIVSSSLRTAITTEGITLYQA